MKAQIKKIFPIICVLAGTAITGLSIGSILNKKITSNELINKILKVAEKFQKDFPQDRVYLHLDKPFYKPGESIWFQAYLRNSTDFKPSKQSQILHVELINPKGAVEKHIELICSNGLTSGDFQLLESSPGGIYKIKAYTNWQRNEPNPPFFEKEIQVQNVIIPNVKMKLEFDRKAFGSGDVVSATAEFINIENKKITQKEIQFIVQLNGQNFYKEKTITDDEGKANISFSLPNNIESNDGLLNVLIEQDGNTESISRSIPIVLNKIDLSFFPEGGDLVNGINSRVAFKTLNEFGKPADIEGSIVDSKGNHKSNFKSFHNGMGTFSLTPEEDVLYYAIITKPSGINEKYPLPESFKKGYTLRLEQSNRSELLITISSTENEKLTLIGAIRDKIIYSEEVSPLLGNTKLKISTENLPIGVARFTLFDSRGIERAERLAFVNKDKKLKVKLETDKENYLPREKVKLTLKVTDDKDIPMPGNFSLSVADDKLLSFADDKTGNILSKLLLEDELKEKIEEPSFYFNSSDPESSEALDYLLLTSGWRRFIWKKMMDVEGLPKLYTPEKNIIEGIVKDQYTGLVISKAKVEIVGKNNYVITDPSGRFSFANVDLSEQTTILVSATNYQNQNFVISEYNSNLQLALYTIQPVFKKQYEKSRPMVAQGNMKQFNMPRAINKMENENLKEADKFMNEMPKADPMEEVMEDEMDIKKPALLEGPENIEIQVDHKFDLDNARAKKRRNTKYYRARQFPSKIYTPAEQHPEIRSDFRTTIYWQGNIETDRTGKAVVEFYNSDAISSFRAIVEGISSDGMIGRSEKVFYTQLPFFMTVKCPVELSTGDRLSLPVTIKNNTQVKILGNLSFSFPEELKVVGTLPSDITVEANASKVLLFDCEVLHKSGKGSLTVAFNSSGLKDAFIQEINFKAKGFPVSLSFSSKELEKEYEVIISHPIEGSLNASLTAYPNVMTDLLQGIESMIREPYGCFEQTSSSNYPNLLIKQFIKEMGEGAAGGGKKFKIPSNLESNLDKGYHRLISFETKEKGYEWFGSTPAHEALTAYGLMEFNDMKKVYNQVDDAMIDRTANWLLGRRDGNGGFKKSNHALDEFGRASEEITNAYIVYALSEAGYTEVRKEAILAYEKAVASNDPYKLALAANCMFNLKEINRGSKVLNQLIALQNSEGGWAGLQHSITRSTGKSLNVETTALALLAALKAPEKNESCIKNGAKYLVSQRSGYGGFGSTQGTVLALKALTSYTIHSKKTQEDGSFKLMVDGKTINVKTFKAGERNPIIINDLSKYLSVGKHRIKVKFEGTHEALPYTIGINYHTKLPPTSPECNISIKTEISSKVMKIGETSRITTILKNTSNEGQPMTMCIVGIPAGVSAQPWQLKELTDRRIIDFFEVRGNNIMFYFRQIKPNETKIIHLDVKAEIAGTFEASATSAYLYYTSEYKTWCNPNKIEIK